MKRPRGRPEVPKHKAKRCMIAVRLSPVELVEIQKAIRASGKTQSDWLRDTLLAAARR